MRRVLSLFVLLVLAQAAPARPDAVLKKLEEASKAVAKKAGPSIVCVYVSRSESYHKAPYWGVTPEPEYPGQLGAFSAAAARKKVPDDAPKRARILRAITLHDLSAPDVVPEAYGSGIIIDRTGLLLTCAHVVKNATKLYVRLPGRGGAWADIWASDPRSDLAVLKLIDPPAGLKALAMGKADEVEPGQIVICGSNAFAPGFRPANSPSFDTGEVRALHLAIPARKGGLERMPREEITLHHYGTLIETNARITPGCSGGALLDLDGKVIGLSNALAAIRGGQAGGSAIPIDSRTRRVIDVLKRGQEVEYGFLGVAVGRWNRARVSQVTPGSPAQKAGLQVGDLIVRVNGHVIRNNSDLFLDLGLTRAGHEARVEVIRGAPIGGTRATYTVRLAKFYVPGPVIAARRPPARFGLRVDYTSILAQRNPFLNWGRPPADGVAIREVVPSSPADRARLQPDKVITQVNGKNVFTPAEFYREMARTGKKVELTFLNSQNRPERITLENR
jgi:serine protease Do